MLSMANCKHENVRFDPQSGSYYIKCCHCDATWMAVDPTFDSPRYEAMKEGYGLTEERRAPFYTPAYTHAYQLQNALALLKITSDPAHPNRLHVNLEDALALLFGRPQADLLSRFRDDVMAKYVAKPISDANRAALLSDAKAFVKRAVSTHVPR